MFSARDVEAVDVVHLSACLPVPPPEKFRLQ